MMRDREIAATLKVLSCLHGIGQRKSLGDIVKLYESMGVVMTRSHFQQVVKPWALSSGYPLGTDGLGMFVATTEQEISLMRDWYGNRIKAEEVNLARLERAFKGEL